MNRKLLAFSLLAAPFALSVVEGPAFADAPARPINKASPTTGPDGNPLSPEDVKELDDLQQAVQSFELASKDYKGTVSHIVKQEFEKKRRELQERYDKQIKDIEKEEKARRADAIALFERFLGKYPNDKRWTPDVIFRLAELYFERSNEEYLAAVDAAQKAADAASKDPNASNNQTPAPVTPEYTKTIDLYKRLIAEFPQYRLLDGAEYLLGYCLGEMNKEPEARQAYLALVCQNKFKPLDPPAPPAPSKKGGDASFVDPYKDCKAVKEDSRFVPEAWTRIGEYHFDYNELELAIAAYARVLNYKDSPYYDKALYKLAWSYYRADKYPEAIKKFDELVVFSDTKKSESGKEGSDLRQEAIQYLGISFAEKDWNGDSIDDTETGLQRIEQFYRGREKEDHVHEVYAKLGDIYFDETEYLKAIEVYKRLLAKWPLDPDNPKVQDKIVLALERMRSFDEALKARGELARYADKNDAWYKANRDKPDKISEAADLAEQALVKYAVDHHKAAQALKKLALASTPPDGKKLELASKEYSLAADGYSKYLERYPSSKNTYDYTFFYAESLYYSQRFAEAAEQYEKVRDSNLDNKYQEDAAFNAVKSYENLVDNLVKAGRLKPPPKPEVGKVPTQPAGADKPGQMVVTPIAVPDEMKKLQAAYDAFAKHVPNSGRLATMTYKAAEVDFDYLHFDDARTRMQDVIDKYCKEPVAKDAGSAMLVTYTIENNLDKIVEWGEKLLKSQCGGGVGTASTSKPGEKGTDAAGIGVTLRDAKFQLAQRLFDQGKFEEAADAFVKIVDGNPKNEGGNNDKALNNAAVGYEKVNRFAAATKIYERIVNEYPKSDFVDDALFRTAVNYQKFFEFDKAVVSYQRLATDPRFKGSKHRTDSLYNAAVILEGDQAYDQSAKLFLQYSQDPNVKKEEQSDAFFRAANIYMKSKNYPTAIKTYKEFLKQFGSDQKKAVEANWHIAEALEAQRDHKGAVEQYKKLEAQGSSVPAASDAAEFPAHAAFINAEAQLAAGLEKQQITLGTSKNAAAEFQKSFTKFKDEIARMTGEYNKVIAYKRVTWSLAGFFRIGYIYELLSKQLSALVTAPCPKEIMKKYKQEGCDVYLEQVSKTIEPQVAAVDEEVVKRYRATLDNAAKLGVSNEWTKLARAHASAFKPEEFPNIKDEHVAFQMEPPVADPPEKDADVQQAKDQIKRGRYEDAITSCRRALVRDERSVPALIAMARAYYYLKKYEFAGDMIALAQKIDPNNAEAYHLLAWISLQKNDSISATQAFKKATELKSDYGNALNSLAAEYDQAKNYDAALEAAKGAVAQLPNFAQAHLNLGSALRGKGEYAEAEKEYRKAIELDSSNADAWFNLGILYLDAPKMGDMDLITKLNTAIGHFSKYKNVAASRLQPNDPVDSYIDEARKGIDREQKRLEREAKKKARDAAKQAQPPAQPPAPAPQQ